MQSLRNANSFHAFSLSDPGLKGRAQQRQMAVAFDPPEAWLYEDQRTGHPAVILVRGGTQPKRFWNRLRTGCVLPTGQAHQDLPEQACIGRPPVKLCTGYLNP